MMQRITQRFRRSGAADIERSYSIFGSWPGGAYRTNWWQLGQAAGQSTDSSAVYACVSIIAQEIARLEIKHYRLRPEGGRDERTDSPLARVMRRPNTYQSRSDFWLYVVSSILTNGNGYASAERDGANRISALHPRPPSGVSPQVDAQTGMLFYDAQPPRVAPFLPYRTAGRNMLHIRCFTDPGALLGISPLRAASMSVQHNQQVQAQQAEFFGNAARPDGILRAKGVLRPGQVKTLQQQWNEAFSGSNSGNTAVLDGDVEFQPLTLSNEDLGIIATLNWGVDDICRVYRVPLWMVGRTDASTYNNVETLGRVFVMQTLGFWIRHIEDALGILFGLPGDEQVRFAVEEGLMRSEFPTRIAALKDAIQGGIYSPNEARSVENLPPVPGGETVFLQAQMETVETRSEAGEEEEPPPEPEREPTPLLDELTAARAHAEQLESRLTVQRMDHAAEVGTLRMNLAAAERRAEP